MHDAQVIGKERNAGVRRVLLVVLALNVLVAVVKLTVGLMTGSLAILADAFHSLIDSTSNVVGLLGVWIAGRPADANHPYGHQRYETIAALSIGVLLALAAYEIGSGVFERLWGGAEIPVAEPAAIAVMAATFVANVAIVLYETRQGKRLNSPVILADAQHTRTDLFVTTSVVAALIGARLGWTWLDPLVALAVVMLLVRAAWSIVGSASLTLTDAAVLDPADVTRIARAAPGVTAVRGVRSRNRGDGAWVDLAIEVDAAMDTAQAHAVASEVERRLMVAMPDVVEAFVHVEPVTATERSWAHLSARLRTLADGLGLGLHDLNAHAEPDGRVSVEMHIEVDATLSLGDAHALVDAFEERARVAFPGVADVVTHIEPLREVIEDEAGRIERAEAVMATIRSTADALAGAGTCHDIVLHNVGGHLLATLHVSQPDALPIGDAHALAERIERALHQALPQLNRTVVHIEPA